MEISGTKEEPRDREGGDIPTIPQQPEMCDDDDDVMCVIRDEYPIRGIEGCVLGRPSCVFA